MVLIPTRRNSPHHQSIYKYQQEIYQMCNYQNIELLNLCFNLSVIVVLPPPETAAIEIIFVLLSTIPPSPFCQHNIIINYYRCYFFHSYSNILISHKFQYVSPTLFDSLNKPSFTNPIFS